MTGEFSSRAECVAKAKEECAGFDLVNIPHGNGGGCWCQKSGGVSLYNNEGDAYDTCRIVALPNATESDEVTGECLEPWHRTNYFARGERSLGPV